MAGWITINGTHVYVKDGESVEEAFSRTTGASLSTKGNPEQTSNAKKFSINDALRNAVKEKKESANELWAKGAGEADRYKMGQADAKLTATEIDEKEARDLTEKGRQARIDRENKANNNIRKAAGKEEKENRNPNFDSERFGKYFDEKGKLIPSQENAYFRAVALQDDSDEIKDIFTKSKGDLNADQQENVFRIMQHNEDLRDEIARNLTRETKEDITNASRNFKGEQRQKMIDLYKQDEENIRWAIMTDMANIGDVWKMDTIVRDKFWRCVEKAAKDNASRNKK